MVQVVTIVRERSNNVQTYASRGLRFAEFNGSLKQADSAAALQKRSRYLYQEMRSRGTPADAARKCSRVPEGSGDSTSHSTGRKRFLPRALSFRWPRCWRVVPMKPLRVDELMRECQTAVISESTLLRQAAETLVVNNLSVLIATSPDGALVGLVPEASIVRHLMATPNRSETVSAILSRHVETVRPDADINSVLHLFRSSCHAVIPVVDKINQVIGLLHRCDVVKMLLENTAVDNDQSGTAAKKPHFLDQSERPTPAENDVPRDSTES